MQRKTSISIGTTVTNDGFSVRVDDKHYAVNYPREVWDAFPNALKQPFADTAAVFFTQHLAIQSNKHLSYAFPPPPAYSIFGHGFLYSVTSAPYEFPKGKFHLPTLIRDVYNAGYASAFTGHSYPVRPMTPYTPDAKKAVMAFSFGKDSLLTYALMRHFGYEVRPFFFEEPTSPFENDNKRKLASDFKKEFSQDVTTIPIQLGQLRDGGGVMWGWDMLLDQYTLFIIPYMYTERPAFFLWSNEQSTNTAAVNPEGYIINPTHEQSVQWMLVMNNLLRMFGANAQLGSVLEPLHEMAELSLLHTTFKDIGKYQLSCFNDDEKSKTQRWCGRCHECARVYILLLGAGINPKQVDFRDDMLATKHKHLHHIFDTHEGLDVLYQSHEERLLAFYLAYKRGVRGGLMNLFAERFLSSVAKKAKQYINTYVSMKSSVSVPPELGEKIIPLYTEHLKRFRADIMKARPTPVDRS